MVDPHSRGFPDPRMGVKGDAETGGVQHRQIVRPVAHRHGQAGAQILARLQAA